MPPTPEHAIRATTTKPFPKELEILAYLHQLEDDYLADNFIDSRVGRPLGELAYTVTTPQGFLAGAGSRTLEILGDDDFAASLDAFLPDHEYFPASAVDDKPVDGVSAFTPP